MIVFSQINEWFFSNLWSIVSLIITLTLAIYFYFKSKKVKLPIYSQWSINIINVLEKKFESLEMMYSGLQIDNLTVTKILFWNGGNDTINDQDISRCLDSLSYIGESLFFLRNEKYLEDSKLNGKSYQNIKFKKIEHFRASA